MSSNPNELNVNDMMARVVDLSLERTTTAVFDKIKSVKAAHDDKKTIKILEEIIDELLEDKRELVSIARRYEDEFVSQKITKEELNKVTEDIIPAITTFIESTEDDEAKKVENLNKLESIKPLVSTEVLDILQTIGFNYKEALGQPLTEILKRTILNSMDDNKDKDVIKLEIAKQEYETAFQNTLQDEEAYSRMLDWIGRSNRG